MPLGSTLTDEVDTQDASVLFQPLLVGALTLQHRLVMTPMVRFRNDSDNVPLLPCVAEYYRQRASSMPGGLLITEATVIAPQAGGSEHVAGIWSDDQVSAWKEVVDAVHRHGGFIFMQLWAMGRVANPKTIVSQGFDYVAPSAISIDGKTKAPRPLTLAEIKEYPTLYAGAASNAVHRAGFDGVEIHGANGHLIDQFLQDVSNKRTDEYGGSVENRTRFALDVVQAVTEAVGEERVGYRISPWDTSHGMRMVDPLPQFDHLVYELERRFPKLAYLHVVEPRVTGEETRDPNDIDYYIEDNDFIRDLWGERPYIASGGVNRNIAIETITEKGGLVAMGRLFLANPDLPLRWLKNKTLNRYDRATFYLFGDATGVGLTDYPFEATE